VLRPAAAAAAARRAIFIGGGGVAFLVFRAGKKPRDFWKKAFRFLGFFLGFKVFIRS